MLNLKNIEFISFLALVIYGAITYIAGVPVNGIGSKVTYAICVVVCVCKLFFADRIVAGKKH